MLMLLLCLSVTNVFAQEEVEVPAIVQGDESTIFQDGDKLEVEVPFEEESLEKRQEKKLVIPSIVYVKCSLDLNQWGHSSNCDCGESSRYDQKLGKCIPKKVTEVKPDKPQTLRCTKDRNRWGHSSNCQCSSDKQRYNQQSGKCEYRFYKSADEPAEEISDTEESLEHCAGGSFSADFKHLTCPDGRVYKEQTNTLGEIGRDIRGDREHDMMNDVIEGEGDGGAARVTER